MERLEKNWLTNGLIDFEYKKYTLLSYLSHVQKQFSDRKLYPILPEVKEHFSELKAYKKYKAGLSDNFTKELTGIDPEHLSLQYRRLYQDSELLNELDAIVDFGLSAFNEKVTIGKELMEFFKEQIMIEPIGISPINNSEGYLFFYYIDSRDVDIYKYMLSPVVGLKDKDDEVKTFFITRMRISLVNTFEQIKKELLKNNKDLPNPAAYSIESKVNMPYQETFIPVAKKLLVSKLAA